MPGTEGVPQREGGVALLTEGQTGYLHVVTTVVAVHVVDLIGYHLGMIEGCIEVGHLLAAASLDGNLA